MRRLNGNSTQQGAIAGASQRRAQQTRPRLVTRGPYPQESLQEVQGFHEFTVYPHH